MSHVRLAFPSADQWLTLSQTEAVTDLVSWASSAAQRFAPDPNADLQNLVTYFRRLGEQYLRVGGTGCLFLLPDGQLPVQALARLETFNGPTSAQAAREQVELLFPPGEWLVDPVTAVTLATGAGPATHLHVRFADPDAADAVVRETVYYMWWFEEVPETLMLSVAFENADLAVQLLGHVDSLAVAATRTNGPQAQSIGHFDDNYIGASQHADPGPEVKL